MFSKKALVLALASLTTNTAWAAADNDALMQELRRLAERVAQLEAANQKLESALGTTGGSQAREINARLDDVENEMMAMRKAPNPLAALDGVTAGASLVFVAQGADGVDTEITARADVEVELPMGSIGEAEGKLFAHFRAGNGEGIDGAVGAWAPSNAMAFGQDSHMDLMQAWYQLDMPVGGASGELGRVEFTVGKIDPFGFFDGNNVADDESEQFLNLAFIHNPLLDAGGDVAPGDDGASPGVRLAYVSDINGGNNITASLGFFGSGEGGNFADSFDSGFVIGQLEYAGKIFGGLSGAYRLYAWTNGNTVDLSDIKDRHTGWGVSLDQEIGGNVTLFSRLGFSTQGEVNFDRALTLGAQVGGAGWGRENDRVGLAYGWLDASDESGMADAEKIVELYYAWQLNEQIALTPDFQWIRNPAGDGTADDATVWGLRAKASF
jgi:hypothetical protein